MATSLDGTVEKTRKLDMILKKGDSIISLLEKQGIAADNVKVRMEEAKKSFSEGQFVTAYQKAQQCINDLMELKKSSGAPKRHRPHKGKGVFALIRDNTTEIKKKLNEWKVITKEWRDKGYFFEENSSLFGRSFEEVEKRFISIGSQIEKAEVIRGKINRVRDEYPDIGKSYINKIDEIERSTFKLDRLDDIERRLSSLENTLKQVNGRFEVLRNRIDRFKRSGFNISSLLEMVENDEDLDYLEKQFDLYEGNVDFLLKEKQKLETFRSDPLSNKFQRKIKEIESIFDDPWKLDLVVQKMLSLENELNNEHENIRRKGEEEARREDIGKSLERFKNDGFKTDVISQLLDEDINLLEEEYDVFVRQTAKLKSLKEKLFKLDATGFEDEVSRISEYLFDPPNVDSVEAEIEHLMDRILDKKVRFQKIESVIKEWSGMGYKVSKLENALKKDMDQAEEIYEDYRTKINELMEFEGKLQDIRYRDLQDIVHKVQLKIKNPELIETIRKEMAYIMDIVSDKEGLRKKRKELNDLLKIWRTQGYKIDHILDIMKGEETVKGLDDIILRFTRAIASLEALKNSFPSEERGWFPTEEGFIGENMDDPEKSNEVLASFEKLKKLNRKEEKRRGEISRKLKELSMRGIDVSRIESYLLEDKDSLDREYNQFKVNVKKLLKIKARLLKEAKKEKDQGKEMLSKSLIDPYGIEGYEAQMKGSSLKPGLSGRKEAKVPPTEEIDKIKDLAKNAYKEKRFDEALRLFDVILSMDPNNKESGFYKKKVLLKLKSIPIKEKRSLGKEGKSKEVPGLPSGSEEPPPPQTETGRIIKGGDPNCLSCKGTGKCVWCDGTGKCSTCNGTGKYLGEKCNSCNGTGECNVCKGSGKCSWCNI